MSKFTVKKLPPIKLVDLLKKRKTTLKEFLTSSGIVAYATLELKCKSMGVSPPSEAEFKGIVGENISSPQEGVIVLDPPALLKDSGEKIQVDQIKVEVKEEVKQEVVEPLKPSFVEEVEVITTSQKSSKKKKETVVENA